jgi:hypothetical protein
VRQRLEVVVGHDRRPGRHRRHGDRLHERRGVDHHLI